MYKFSILLSLMIGINLYGMEFTLDTDNEGEHIPVTVFQKEGNEVEIPVKKSLLEFFTTLDRNYKTCDLIDGDPEITTIAPKTFTTVLSLIESVEKTQDSKKQRTQLLEHLKKQNNNRLAKIYNAANFLGCDLLLETCLQESYERIKNSNNIAYKMWYLNQLVPDLSILVGKLVQRNSEAFDKFNQEKYSYNTIMDQKVHPDGPVLVAISPATDLIATGSGETVILWDGTFNQVRTLRYINEQSNFASPTVRSLAFSPTQSFLAAGYSNGDFLLWDSQSGALKVKINLRCPSVTAISFSPDGKQLVVGGTDGIVHFYEFVKKGLLRKFDQKFQYRIDSLKFSPDGSLLLIKYDHITSVWDLQQHRDCKTFRDLDIDFTEHAKKLIRSSGQGLDIFELETNTYRVVFDDSVWFETPRLVARSLRGDYVVVYYNSTLHIWNPGTKKSFAAIKVDPVSSVSFSADGQYLICGFYDGSVKVINLHGRSLAKDCYECTGQQMILLEQLLASGIKREKQINFPCNVEKNIKKLTTLESKQSFFERWVFKKPSSSHVSLPKSIYAELYNELPDKVLEFLKN